MAILRIALANLPFATTPEDSVARAVRAIDDAAVAKVDIICFPECYVPGYRGPDSRMAPPDAVASRGSVGGGRGRHSWNAEGHPYLWLASLRAR